MFGRKKKKMKNDIDAMLKKAAKLENEFILAKNEKKQWDEKYDREETIYMGGRKFGNIYSDSTKDDARTTVKISQALIEAQIDLSVPDAVFKPVAQDDEQAVKELQAEADYTIRSANLEEINSIAEREVKKYGMQPYKVMWNKRYRCGDIKGRPEIIAIHPKNILWAAGTTDRNKCRCWYHIENITLQEARQVYGEIADLLPEYGLAADSTYDEVGEKEGSNVNNTNDINNTVDLYSRDDKDPLSKYVIVEKWYLDEEDEACMTVFSDRLILLEEPKYYHRRKFKVEIDKDGNEKVVQDFDEEGKELFVEDEKLEEDYNPQNQVKFNKGETIPYYYPKGPLSLPFVIQNNIPRSKAIPGISDIERTYDYEQSMKKILHKHEERMLKGTSKILYDKMTESEAAQQLDNDELNIIGVKDVNMFKVVDFKADDNMTLNFYQFLLENLQFEIGITPAWQGINEGQAKSGKALQTLVNQTSEKVSIKVNEKNLAFKRIYKLLCNHILCFSDGDRPYRLDNTLQPEYGVFNRYDLIKKDSSGNYMYIDYDIEVGAENGFPRTKTAMAEMIIQMASQGFFEIIPRNLLVWQLLNKIGFPNADSILQTIQGEIEKQQQMQMQLMAMQKGVAQGQQMPEIPQQILDSMPDEVREQFLALPPQEQAQALQGGKNVQG